ncbi:hypothetical protein [Barnesiella viscericola]|uniref:hypothetical protein n=1 Tax=Barnesiella viscericola TaxID=397865 RepID=UPI00255C1C4C|nr:hypothetical protein [Barnesiella viscericola]
MRNDREGISGYRVVARYDVEHRIKCGMTERVFPGYRVEHRVTPHSDAGSSKVPLVGIAFAGIPGFRIKCGMTERVFLDTASRRGMT